MLTGLDEARLYHDHTGDGYAALCHITPDGKFHQRGFPVADLSNALEAAPGDLDCYLSQATFRVPSRRFVHFEQISVCYADLDVYKMPDWIGRDPEHAAMAMLLQCEDAGIPRPSLINHSGRGIQVKWLLDSPVGSEGLTEWTAVQRRLVTSLSDFGADATCAEACRVLRIVGSVNTKSKQRVRTIYPDSTPSTWDFEILRNEVMDNPRFQPAPHMPGKQRVLSADAAAACTGGLTVFSPARLWSDRLHDLRILARLRGWHESGAPEGTRHTLLFLATVALGYFVAAADLEAEIMELHQTLCPTLPIEEAQAVAHAAVQRARQGVVYKYANPTLIAWLGITDREQEALQTIISPELAQERHRRRNRSEVDRDRVAYIEECAERNEQISHLRASGLSLSQIATTMGCTSNAVSKALARNRNRQR